MLLSRYASVWSLGLRYQQLVGWKLESEGKPSREHILIRTDKNRKSVEKEQISYKGLFPFVTFHDSENRLRAMVAH